MLNFVKAETGEISRMIGTKCPDNYVVWTSFQSNRLGHSSTVPTSPWKESRLPLMGVRSVCLKALNQVLNCRADKQQNKQTDQPWVILGLAAGWTWKRRSQMPAVLLLTRAPGKLCSVLQFIWIMTVSTFHLRLNNGLYPCGPMYMKCCFFFHVSPKRFGGN